jgi:cytochrome c-type biogenesis protein CcmE
MTATPPSTAAVRRRRAQVAIAACVAAIVAIIVLAFVLSENVVYFRTVSEAVKMRASEGDHQLRIAGAVVPGSVHETANGVRFKITDGKKTAEINHHGDPPELFAAKVPVVCEGHWRNDTFSSERILIRHGNNYSPPKVDTDKGQ